MTKNVSTAALSLATQARVYFDAHRTKIPTLSSHSSRVLAMSAHVMDADIAELIMLVRSDAACAVELLRVANSSAYASAGHPVAALDEAIIRLGRREVYNILAAVAMRSLFEPKLKSLVDLLGEHWYRLQHHAVSCAFASGWLTTYLKLSNYEELFLAGMFHDIGKLGILFSIGSLMLQGETAKNISRHILCEALEVNHVETGVNMLQAWQMPRRTVDLCQLHQGPAHTVLAPPVTRPVAEQVHMIRIISHLNVLRDNAFVPVSLDEELKQSIKALRLTDDALIAIAQKMQVVVESVSTLLGPPKHAA